MVNQFGGGSGGGSGSVKVSPIQVSLVGTGPATILPVATGSYVVNARCQAAGGPSFICNASKTTSTSEVELSNVQACPSLDDTRLVVEWLSGGSLSLKKDKAGWNGPYDVYLLG